MSRWFRNITQPLRALEELTRPPRRPFADLDEPLVGCPNPMDCEYGCAGDCSEAGEPRSQCLGCGDADTDEHECGRDDTPNPADEPRSHIGRIQADGTPIWTFEDTEPGLSPDELVGVRGLLQERYEDDPAVEADVVAWSISGLFAWTQRTRRTDVRVQCGHCLRVVGGISDFAGHMLTCDLKPITKTSASVKSTPGIGAEPNSPAASAAGDSPSEVCGHSPVPPSEGRPTSELLTDAANHIYYDLALWTELRARAEVFRRVEDEGHDVGLSWAAETFPQFRTNK